ncbi:MAG: ATP-binding protein [Dissulfuribacterales bacterium]
MGEPDKKFDFDSEIIIRDSITIRDDLFFEVDSTMEFVKKHISKRMIITGKAQRDEVWEYPLEAVREIVINMIVHRDYRAVADSTLKIFGGRIEFFNPGGLPRGIRMQDILSGKIASNPRNKQIASIFKEAGIIEKYGSVIKRVRQTMTRAGVPDPIFETIADSFKVTLFPLNDSLSGGVSGGVLELLEFINNNPGNNARQMQQQLGISQRTIERLLKKFRDQGKIEFRGAPKTGGY